MEVEQWLSDNQIGIDIWHKKYQFNNETLDEFFDRVSGGVEELKETIINKEFLPGGRILAGRGVIKNGRKVSTSNCYVITDPEDNIESIFECAKKMARTYSYGGGCGTDLSKLSPRGATVRNAAKTTSGPLPFMDLFSATTDVIGQAGRRGALMLTLSCEHPDIEEFIDVKKDLNKVTKANISVRFTKRFMEAAREDKVLEVSFTREETGETIVKGLRPLKLLEKMAQNNWEMGEPGALFWDEVQNWNLNSNNPEYKITSTNPCGEQPLFGGASCLLGSINLAAFVNDAGEFNVNRFKEVVHIAIRGLNKILDESIELHPLEEQRIAARDWRNCGLGIMGLADCFIKMGITYGSEQSQQFSSILASTLIKEAIRESAALAEKEGAYPKCKPELIINTPFFQEVIRTEKDDNLLNLVKEHGLRNCALLTIAPTGTLSTMLGISGGIEPIFANSYTRKTESLNGGDTYYKIYTPIVDKYMKAHGIEKEEDLPKFFITAGQILPEQRVIIQSIWQHSIDAAISSTVNLPENTTPEQILDIYITAYEMKCKGITVFRDNCFRTGILTTGDKKTENEPKRGEILTVDDTLVGLKRKLMTGCGSMYCCPYYTTNGEMREIFLSKGSSGVCLSFMTALGRLISLCLRGGISQEAITDQLLSIPSCPSYVSRAAVQKDTSKGKNCPSAIAYALMEMSKQIKTLPTSEPGTIEIKEEPEPPKETARVCPICGNELVPTNGCWSCTCGYSKCEG